MADEVRVTSATGGAKGSKDCQLAWADPRALTELGNVFGYGATKYSPTNYRLGYDWSLSYSALQRHLLAFWGGEDNDPESGLPHLAHAMWHCHTLMSFGWDHLEYDDRIGADGARPPVAPYEDPIRLDFQGVEWKWTDFAVVQRYYDPHPDDFYEWPADWAEEDQAEYDAIDSQFRRDLPA